MKTQILAGVAAMAMGAAPAMANHFTSIDLGAVTSREACMAQADAAFRAMASQRGQNPDIATGSWTISSFSVAPLDADITVLCVQVQGVWNAFATGHSPGEGDPPEAIIDDLNLLFSGGTPSK